VTATGQETSAPWTAKKLDANHSMVHDAAGMTVVPRMITEPGTPSEHRAELIAAAPELAEALADLASLVKDGYQYNDIAVTRSLTQARNALAKAGAK
jgi:hypothetical protein